METKEEQGDIYFAARSVPFTYAKLAIGKLGQYLKLNTGEPAWKDASIDDGEYITE